MTVQLAQRYPGMRLLLFAEQTTDRQTVETLKAVPLAPLKTGDGRVSFKPVVFYRVDNFSSFVSLRLTSCVTACAAAVYCRMTGRYYLRHDEANQPAKSSDPLTDEAQFFLTNNVDSERVVSLKMRPNFEKVTILLVVYEIAATQAATGGAGLHLNRARLKGTLCDVKLVVEGVELAAHRNVLAARSPVLEKMFTGEFKEAREGRVELVDASRAAVERFLEFLYTDHIEDWHGSELELLQLADKYLVPELRAECSLRLWSSDGPRALELLQLAAGGKCKIINSPLRRRLTAIVVDSMTELEKTSEWEEFKAAHPILVDVIYGTVGATTHVPTSSVWDVDTKFEENY